MILSVSIGIGISIMYIYIYVHICVRGVNLGDGWVVVGNRFLPIEVDGKRVLLQQESRGNYCCWCYDYLLLLPVLMSLLLLSYLKSGGN